MRGPTPNFCYKKPHILLIYEMFCVGPWVVWYLNNHLKFQQLKKNNENHDSTLLTAIPMAPLDA